jgi:hypothetical protein
MEKDNRLSQPTPYAEVNVVLNLLLSNVQAVLGDRFIGLYLYGSLASGDFDPQRSDIDFVVVTADEIPDEMIPALEALHARLAASGLKWAAKLEGAFLPQPAIRRYDPDDARQRPWINEGRFYLGRQGSDWIIQRHILREQGVVVAGPALQTLIDPVQPNDLRRAVLGVLHEWWSPMLHDPAWLRGSEYQAYAVLTLCRALYTLEHGTVVSKPAAARWVQQALGEPKAALIEQALTWRHEMPSDILNETLEFIRYTLERARQFEILMNEA